MPDLLLELFGEEMPARFQRRASDDLRRLVTDALVEAGLVYESAAAFATPRRLCLHIQGLPDKGQDVREVRRGPRVGAPEQAIKGFVQGAGLTSVDQVKVETDAKKGDFYVAVIETPGRPTAEIIRDILPAILRAFPWPKSMRWGDASVETSSLRWVRPLTSIVCMLSGDGEGEEPAVIPFEIDGLVAGDTTYGHRFMAPDAIRVKRFEDYADALLAAKVVLDPERRKAIIAADAASQAFALGLELVEDQTLLDEVAGLVEWPVVHIGTFDESFLSVPPEVIRATIRTNQKCFVLRRLDDGELSNRFVLTANIEASDGGTAIVAGNERVVRARLSDAMFFWDTDRATSLDEHASKLRNVTFHEKLGGQYERAERLALLATAFAPMVGAEAAQAERAGRLSKADLVTEMVGEFPELQGLMGRYYAAAQGEHADVCAAIQDHYKPAGPSDRVPSAPVSIAVALADKVDLLVGFWGINEKPTGSKDPFALRRAALGIIRLILDNGLSLSLKSLFAAGESAYVKVSPVEVLKYFKKRDSDEGVRPDVADDLVAFLIERLKVVLKDKGLRHDVVDAVLTGGTDDLVLIVSRARALADFLTTQDGGDLLGAYRRAANILRSEERKDGRTYGGEIDYALIAQSGQIEEKMLAVALAKTSQLVGAAMESGDVTAAMSAIADARPSVDAFFEKVVVNSDDPAIRENRLNLLSAFITDADRVADLSRVEG